MVFNVEAKPKKLKDQPGESKSRSYVIIVLNNIMQEHAHVHADEIIPFSFSRFRNAIMFSK